MKTFFALFCCLSLASLALGQDPNDPNAKKRKNNDGSNTAVSKQGGSSNNSGRGKQGNGQGGNSALKNNGGGNSNTGNATSNAGGTGRMGKAVTTNSSSNSGADGGDTSGSNNTGSKAGKRNKGKNSNAISSNGGDTDGTANNNGAGKTGKGRKGNKITNTGTTNNANGGTGTGNRAKTGRGNKTNQATDTVADGQLLPNGAVQGRVGPPPKLPPAVTKGNIGNAGTNTGTTGNTTGNTGQAENKWLNLKDANGNPIVDPKTGTMIQGANSGNAGTTGKIGTAVSTGNTGDTANPSVPNLPPAILKQNLQNNATTGATGSTGNAANAGGGNTTTLTGGTGTTGNFGAGYREYREHHKNDANGNTGNTGNTAWWNGGATGTTGNTGAVNATTLKDSNGNPIIDPDRHNPFKRAGTTTNTNAGNTGNAGNTVNTTTTGDPANDHTWKNYVGRNSNAKFPTDPAVVKSLQAEAAAYHTTPDVVYREYTAQIAHDNAVAALKADPNNPKLQAEAKETDARYQHALGALYTDINKNNAPAANGGNTGNAGNFQSASIAFHRKKPENFKFKTRNIDLVSKPRNNNNRNFVQIQFHAGNRIPESQNWKGPKYGVFKSYHSEWHDRNWWQQRHGKDLVLVNGGYYYRRGLYWFPAWGYDQSASFYAYDGPIYAHNNLPPDQVVANVQTALQELGYYQDGEVDGMLGPMTREALSQFQADNQLEPTGSVDQPTLESLGMT